jgi:hypothetical protein
MFDDLLTTRGNGGSDDMDIVLVGQGNAVQGLRIGNEVRGRERFLHFLPCINQARRQVTEFVATISHPLIMDDV